MQTRQFSNHHAVAHVRHQFIQRLLARGNVQVRRRNHDASTHARGIAGRCNALLARRLAVVQEGRQLAAVYDLLRAAGAALAVERARRQAALHQRVIDDGHDVRCDIFPFLAREEGQILLGILRREHAPERLQEALHGVIAENHAVFACRHGRSVQLRQRFFRRIRSNFLRVNAVKSTGHSHLAIDRSGRAVLRNQAGVGEEVAARILQIQPIAVAQDDFAAGGRDHRARHTDNARVSGFRQSFQLQALLNFRFSARRRDVAFFLLDGRIALFARENLVLFVGFQQGGRFLHTVNQLADSISVERLGGRAAHLAAKHAAQGHPARGCHLVVADFAVQCAHVETVAAVIIYFRRVNACRLRSSKHLIQKFVDFHLLFLLSGRPR